MSNPFTPYTEERENVEFRLYTVLVDQRAAHARWHQKDAISLTLHMFTETFAFCLF